MNSREEGVGFRERNRERRDLVGVGPVRVFDENGRRVGGGRRGSGGGGLRRRGRRPLLVVGVDSGTGHFQRVWNMG